jgi:hypothetical protein
MQAGKRRDSWTSLGTSAIDHAPLDQCEPYERYRGARERPTISGSVQPKSIP